MLTKKSKKIKKERGAKARKIFFTIIIASLFIFFIYSCLNMCLKIMDLNRELDSLEESQEELLKQRESLKFSLGEAYSESYLEKVAREDLNFRKPGETIYVIKKEGEVAEENGEIIKEQTLVERIQAFLKSFNK